MSFNDHCSLVVTELTLYIGGYLFIWYSVILNIIILQYFWHTTLRLQTDVLFWVRHFFYEFVSMHHITWQDLLLLHVLFDDMCCVIMCSQWKNYYNTSTNTVTAHIVHRQKDTFRTCCWGDWASTCLNNNSWISLETQSRWRSVTCLPSSGLGKNEYKERPNWTLACIYKYSTYMDSMKPAVCRWCGFSSLWSELCSVSLTHPCLNAAAVLLPVYGERWVGFSQGTFCSLYIVFSPH